MWACAPRWEAERSPQGHHHVTLRPNRQPIHRLSLYRSDEEQRYGGSRGSPGSGRVWDCGYTFGIDIVDQAGLGRKRNSGRRRHESSRRFGHHEPSKSARSARQRHRQAEPAICATVADRQCSAALCCQSFGSLRHGLEFTRLDRPICDNLREASTASHVPS